MKRYFNITGACSPYRHYMVSLDDRVKQIKEQYVDRGSYFVINRGRQYGKTTTLKELAELLKDEYIVISMDFQLMSTEDFRDAVVFSGVFANLFEEAFFDFSTEDDRKQISPIDDFIRQNPSLSLRELFRSLSNFCKAASKPVVMIIDEVDSASNNQVFIDFLAQLRGYYLDRDRKPIFHSVILAGVYDIKNLKLKIRPEAERQYNSPWNTHESNEGSECLHSLNDCPWDQIAFMQFDIAAKFNMDMAFSAKQIADMLQEYERDNHTGMDVDAIAHFIYDYTSGYPYLVSAICKLIDEDICGQGVFIDKGGAWTKEGVEEAVKTILSEKTTLFESMAHQMSEYPEIKQMLKAVLFQGKKVSYNLNAHEINLAAMFGYIRDNKGSIQVANRVFEMCLCYLFLSEEELTEEIYDKAQGNISQFIRAGRLDMDFVLEKFVEYFNEIYGSSTEQFLETNGRRLFLLYLKPIINGTGNYYLEAQTRDARRTDVIVDYLGEQFVIEMKIWHGSEYNKRGEGQLTDYLDYYHLDKGYMLSFNFNKEKEIGVKEITVGTKVIVEAVV